MKISDLKFWEINPRKISDVNLEKLKRSLKDDPDFLSLRKILVNETKDGKVVYAGNQRLKGLLALGYEEIPDDRVNIEKNLSKKIMRKRAIKDNVEYGEWDRDILDQNFDKLFLDELDLPDGELPLEDTDIGRHNPTGKSLSSKFIIPPFSIRDSKQGYWAERKKIRNQLIQDVGESREGTLYTQKTIDGFNDIMGRSGEKAKSISSVSILDAVLAECLIRFFCVEKGTTFDPFAGDSVFGYVSGYLERPFKGIELRKEQSEINQKRCDDAKLNCKYYTDTSENMDKYIKNDTVDMVFSCPPYRNLERYSDDKNDLSNKTKDDFFFTIKGILTNTYKKLKDDCFACIVIGEVRDKDGGYINFVGETIKIMIDAGYTYYNEIIYLQQIGPKCLTAERQFNSGRKVSKIHQNILIFYKGNPKNIKSKYKELDFSEIDFRTLITKTDESTDI